jgi:hypothetical protein
MSNVKIKHLFIYFIFALSTISRAEIINVPGDQPTIQAGIDSAMTGDTVLVESGIYIENINFNGKNIVVASDYLTSGDTSFISQTIIDGNQNGSVVTFENDEDTTSVLKGFTITNGNSVFRNARYYGGGICIYDAGPKIEWCTISNNYVTQGNFDYGGGGINIVWGQPLLKNLIIRNNEVYGHFVEGGGIYILLSSAILQNIRIENNYSDDNVGGISIENSTLQISNVIIKGNDAAGAGGGIGIGYSNLYLSNAEIFENTAISQGGGMVVGLCSPVFENVIIRNNHSNYRGGGIDAGLYTDLRNCYNVIVKDNTADLWGGGISFYALSDSTVFLSNVLVSGNWAGNGGGGVYFRNQKPVLNNVTIVNNTCPNRGGGIFARAINFENHSFLINCIVRNNSIEQIHFEDSELTVTHCNIEDSLSGIINDSSVVNWLSGNIDEDPLFTDTLNEIYTLQPGSPCIDTGIDFFEWQGRVWLYLPASSYIGSAPDMGAYEFDPASYIVQHKPVIASNFHLYQNYPNPFNPSTTFHFYLNKKCPVKLIIYDNLGRKINTLISKTLYPGEYKIPFTSNNLPSGIYYCSFITTESKETIKLNVIK